MKSTSKSHSKRIGSSELGFLGQLFSVSSIVLVLSLGIRAKAQDGPALIQKMMNAYQALNSYEGRANADEIFMNGNTVIKQGSLAVHMIYKKPEKLKLEFTSSHGSRTVSSDGKEMITYDGGGKTFHRGSSAATLENLLPLLSKQASVSSVLDPLYFLSLNHLPKNLTGLKLKAQDKYNGHPVYIVTGVIPSDRPVLAQDGKSTVKQRFNQIWTWWIDKSTNLILKNEARVDNVPFIVNRVVNKKPTSSLMKVTYIVRQIITETKINPALNDAIFRFVPPPGAKETKSVEELLSGKDVPH